MAMSLVELRILQCNDVFNRLEEINWMPAQDLPIKAKVHIIA